MKITLSVVSILAAASLCSTPAMAERMGGGSTIDPGVSVGTRSGVFVSVGRGDKGDHRGWRGRHGRFRGSGLLGYAEPSYRHNRTALSNGYFGDGGSDGRGGYDYDRGYPYDHYDGGYEEDYADEPAEPREVRCEMEAGVNVCRG